MPGHFIRGQDAERPQPNLVDCEATDPVGGPSKFWAIAFAGKRSALLRIILPGFVLHFYKSETA
jgi:hypothetical protein